MAPSQQDVMYAGGGVGSGASGPFTESGVFKSTDHGATWTSINVGLTDAAINVLWIDSSNPSVLLAGTEFGGLFRTTNGGQSWSGVLSHAPVSAILSVANGLLAGSGMGLEFSGDDGITWTLLQQTNSAVRCLATANGYTIAGLQMGDVLWKAPSDQSWGTVASNPQLSVTEVAIDPKNPSIALHVASLGPSPRSYGEP